MSFGGTKNAEILKIRRILDGRERWKEKSVPRVTVLHHEGRIIFLSTHHNHARFFFLAYLSFLNVDFE